MYKHIIYTYIRVGIIKSLLDVILLLCICTPYILAVTKYSSVYYNSIYTAVCLTAVYTPCYSVHIR